jgi:hypothetical protein
LRRSATRLVFALLAVAAVLLAARAIASQWRAFRDSGAHLSPRWSLIALSSVLVLVAYAVLVETWRRTVRAWDAELPWGEAARIWFISNLGRYLPGKVWQIGAMGVMAQEQGVSVVAATGSALVINLVNLLAGVGVVLVTGAEFFEARNAALAFGALLLAGIVLAPRLVPFIGRLAGKVIGRPLDVPTLPDRAVWLAASGGRRLLYGVAFQCFVAGSRQARGVRQPYIAFTGSYLAGYIALFAPGASACGKGRSSSR